MNDKVVVKSIFKETGLYKNWTPVSKFLACGLVGVKIKFVLKLIDLRNER